MSPRDGGSGDAPEDGPMAEACSPSALGTQVFSRVPAAQDRLKSYLCDAHPGKKCCLSVYGHSPGSILILRCVVSRWYAYIWAWQVALVVKNLSAKADTAKQTLVQSLGQEDPLEEGTATHSSTLAWRIPTDRGAWVGCSPWVAERQTGLRGLSMRAYIQRRQP